MRIVFMSGVKILCPEGDSRTQGGAQAAGGHSLLPSVAASEASPCGDRHQSDNVFCSFLHACSVEYVSYPSFGELGIRVLRTSCGYTLHAFCLRSMASFYASELEARSSPSRSASSSACAGASPARRRAVPVAQLWRDAIRAVVADALAEASSSSLRPLPAGKRRARSTMHDDFVDRQSAAGALAMQLDLACVARILASTQERPLQAPGHHLPLSLRSVAHA